MGLKVKIFDDYGELDVDQARFVNAMIEDSERILVSKVTPDAYKYFHAYTQQLANIAQKIEGADDRWTLYSAHDKIRHLRLQIDEDFKKLHTLETWQDADGVIRLLIEIVDMYFIERYRDMPCECDISYHHRLIEDVIFNEASKEIEKIIENDEND